MLIKAESLKTTKESSNALQNLSLAGVGVDSFLMYSAQNSTLLPNWWSEIREKYLRIASIENDLISSVIQTMVMKLFTLPLKVVPKNQYINSAVTLADTYNTILRNSWNSQAEMFLNDVLTFDKGGFLLIEGKSNISEPFFQGEVPTGLRHIPSQFIQLIDNTEFPYRYVGLDGNQNIGIHWSRVIRLAQIPTAISEKSYIGLSFVSRAFNVAQLMMSSIQYGLEGLGKIDSDQIVWGTSVTSQAIKQAFKDARIESANTGLKSNGSRVFLGLRDPQAKIDVLDLKRLPANFSYEEFLKVTVKLLAIAAGIDEDDIVATSNAGTTKTATLISDLKSKFKLVSWFTSKIELEIDQKFLPSNLTMQIGETSGEINETEAKTRINIARTDEILKRNNILSDRVARQNAVLHGFITQTQFVSMELADGRLENGLPIHTLFLSNNEMIKNMLDIGLITTVDIENNLSENIVQNAKKKLIEVDTIATNTTSDNIFNNANQCRAALVWIIDLWEEPESNVDIVEPDILTDETQIEEETVVKKSNRPKTKYGREGQAEIRKLVKDIWNGSNTTNHIMNDFENVQNQVLHEKIKNNIVELKEFIQFVENNNQKSGVKLKDIFSRLDEIIDFD